MQSDILYKQLITKLNDLKTAIERFERHNPPSTTYTEELHKALNEANKFTSAYAVLKEQKDVSPDLNLHLKLMNIEKVDEEIKNTEVKSATIVETKTNETPINTTPLVVEEKEELIVEEKMITSVAATTISVETVIVPKPTTPDYPRFTININDKFRIINELFLGNSTEYNMAIEQLNTLNSPTEATVYLRELKNIYNWNDESEMVKKVTALVQKRFA